MRRDTEFKIYGFIITVLLWTTIGLNVYQLILTVVEIRDIVRQVEKLSTKDKTR